MKTTRLVHMLAPVLLVIGGCSLLGHKEEPPLMDTTWELRSFTPEGEEISPPNNQPYGIRFVHLEEVTSREQLIAGPGFFLVIDCNGGSGTYEVSSDGSISLNPAVQTLVGCGDDSYQEEFIRLLREVDTYTVTDDQLLLTSSGDDSAVLTFARTNSLPDRDLE